ncbi:MAG TPA: hypothetical protein VH640_29045 [Bryobacteraceae bacterium]
MPNFRAVTAGTKPPPPTPKEAFKIASKDSFDYSAFAFVGITSALAEWSNAHPQLGEGLKGYGRYYWRGFVDKTDGNYLVTFAFPTLLHQDERYYAKGKGGFFSRAVYAASRVLITPNYQGHDTFKCLRDIGSGCCARCLGFLLSEPGPKRGHDCSEVRMADWTRCARQRNPRILAGYQHPRSASEALIRKYSS